MCYDIDFPSTKLRSATIPIMIWTYRAIELAGIELLYSPSIPRAMFWHLPQSSCSGRPYAALGLDARLG
jgi:hypothetical protein